MSDIDSQGCPALAPRVRLQMDTVSGEPVLLYPEGIVILNPTAHEIVTRFDGRTTADGIVHQLVEAYDESEENLRKDVMETLADLKHRNLIIFST